MKRGMSPLCKQGGMSPNIRPGLFSNPSELGKLNKQKSMKIEEVQTPNLFENKIPPPKLQKSYSASKLVSNRDSLKKLPKPMSKYEQLTSLSQQLLQELENLNDGLENNGGFTNDLEEWSGNMIEKLLKVKNCLEENLEESDIVSGIQSDILLKLQKELNEEKKQRFRIEEEATNLITEQEIEIDRLERQLRSLEGGQQN